MDKKALIEKLNEDLGLEYQSIVQYIHHIATIKGAEFQRMLVELEKHLGEELQHALALARQIDFLGGVPNTHVPDVDPVADTVKALRQDLELERQQLERYRARVDEANEVGLPDVAEALGPVLRQTQDHIRDLETALGD